MENENKWEYDYSTSNNETGYPNVGSSGMNTANQYNEPEAQPARPADTAPADGGSVPPIPPEQPQYSAPAQPEKPRRKKFNGKKLARSAVALVLAAAMGFAGGFVGAKYGGGSKVVIQQVERSSDPSSGSAAGTTVSSSGMTTAQVAEMVSPSVVVITTEQVVYSQWSWYGQSQVESGAGSGVIISSDGYILTCDHVVSGASNITVTIGDKDYTATVVGEDSTSDIAVIKVDADGLTPAIVEKLSQEKNDPVWMQQFRLHSLQIYNETPLPDWGPSLAGLDMDHIATYVRPNTKMQNDWKNVPQDIKDTFERLGIPEAERKSLAGVGAQYDSELVYHNVRAEVAAQGVVYTDMESALHGEYADMVRKYFMKLVPPTDHKFAALHGAVWSGGSFVYVPKGVHLSIPLQSYFRLNAKGAGQFEHTLIIVDKGAYLHFIEGCSAPKYNVANLHAGCVEIYVGENARVRYSTIENWSKNMYNLNTKRALVEEGGTIEWVSGSFGSHVSYLYPMSVLNGKGARAEFTGITFAGAGQNLDTGTKVVHNAPETTSYINTKSISKDGGISTFRSSVV